MCYKLGEHDKTSLEDLWAFDGFQITLKLTVGYVTISGPEGVRRNALRAMCPKSPHSEDETRA